MNNEGIEIIEDPEYHIDNPGSGNWPTVPKDSDANSTDGFFNVPNRVGDEAFLNMCRVLNSVQYFCTYCIVSKPGNSCPCICISQAVLRLGRAPL